MEGIHQSLSQQTLQSTVEDLPDEVLEFVLSLLPPYNDLQNCMLVCKRWYTCAQNVLHKASIKLIKAVGEFDIMWKNIATEMIPTITRRFSHAACIFDNNMYVFGGCTTNATSFNDLWKFDLSKRQWVRPLATGTYPVPKAYTTMVPYKETLVVFGGWTYPSLSQYYQHVTMFNEIHFYDVKANKWILGAASNPESTGPPPMAGHSACIKDDEMVVFGGLIMSPAYHREIQCTNDVWVLNVITLTWRKQPTTKPKPSPRYAQSLIRLDPERIMMLGGVQTLHNRFVYSDCWILTMRGPVWTWKEIAVKNKEWASANIWCNPACKVGDKVVSLSRSRNGWNSAKPLVTSAVRLSALNRPEGSPVSVRVEQSLQRPLDRDQNINGRRGELPRRPPNSGQLPMNPINEPVAGPSSEHRRPQNLPIFEENAEDASVGPSNEPRRPGSGLCLVRKDSPIRGTKKNRAVKIVRQLQEAERYRMAAFACDNTFISTRAENEIMNQRHVARLENRIDELPPIPPPPPPPQPNQQRQPLVKKIKRNTLTMHVLDISTVIVENNSLNYVTWLCPRLGEMNGAPEELVMYSLLKGTGELIMFGGVNNDISILNYSEQQNMYSNSLHFITPPKDII